MIRHNNDVALLLTRKKDARICENLLDRFASVCIWSGLPCSSTYNESPHHNKIPSLLIIDGQALWLYHSWLLKQRTAMENERFYVLLLLAPGRARAWPEKRYRLCYDDVLQAPLDKEEMTLRVQQLLNLKDAERKNTYLYKKSLSDVRQLQEEKKKSETLISTLAHDLRSPLTAARLNAERLKKDLDPAAREKKVLRVLAGIDRVNLMIEELLDAARDDKKTYTKDFTSKCDLHYATQIVINQLETSTNNRFINRVTFGLTVPVEESRIIRVLENLCGNAIKYGYKDMTITIEGYIQEKSVTLQVLNYGEPLPDGLQSRLFDDFEQAEGSDTAQKGCGWGLGLAMVRATAEAYNGTTRVSRDSQGRNVFGMRFPHTLSKQQPNLD